MFTRVILGVLLIFLLYTYISQNGQFRTTTSALSEVWSGDCRLACRRSGYGVSNDLSSNAILRKQTSRVDCVCETCPCSLVEIIVRTCEPAVHLCSQISDHISYVCSNLVNTIIALCDYIANVFAQDVDYQRQVQMMSDQNINLSKNRAEAIPSPPPLLDPPTKKSSRFKLFRRSSSGSGHTKADTKKTSKSRPTGCSKCAEQGKLCLADCPKAKKI